MLMLMNEQRAQQRKREIGAKVRQARERAGLSQEGLGTYFNVSGAAVSRWESGRVDISIPVLEEIARIVDQPLQFFTGQAAPRRDTEAEALGRAVLKLVEERQMLTEKRLVPLESNVRIFPIINRVPADDARVRDTQIEDNIGLEPFFWRGASDPRVYVISGDCMALSGILDGDHVVIDTALRDPTEGKVVLAEINGALTLKRFFRVGDRVELRPNAPGYDTIYVKPSDELIIVGCLHQVVPTGAR
jgi:SOS-response transcriptional repressor LexA/DNA-binding transcriptional regulator YiaG